MAVKDVFDFTATKREWSRLQYPDYNTRSVGYFGKPLDGKDADDAQKSPQM